MAAKKDWIRSLQKRQVQRSELKTAYQVKEETSHNDSQLAGQLLLFIESVFFLNNIKYATSSVILSRLFSSTFCLLVFLSAPYPADLGAGHSRPHHSRPIVEPLAFLSHFLKKDEIPDTWKILSWTMNAKSNGIKPEKHK